MIKICGAREVVETRARRVSINTRAPQMLIKGKTMFDRYSYIKVHKNCFIRCFKQLNFALSWSTLHNAFSGPRRFGPATCAIHINRLDAAEKKTHNGDYCESTPLFCVSFRNLIDKTAYLNEPLYLWRNNTMWWRQPRSRCLVEQTNPI